MTAKANEARAARYRKSKAAQAEIERRVLLALDRLRVAADPNPAQFLHAVHYLDRGYANDSRIVPPEAPDFHVDHETAERVALDLYMMLVWATNARSTVGEAE